MPRTGYDRNYLRHEILPRLRVALAGDSGGTDAQCRPLRRGHRIAPDLANQDLAALRGPAPGTLKIDRLQLLDVVRQDNALRAWLRELGLPTPSTAHLRQVALCASDGRGRRHALCAMAWS